MSNAPSQGTVWVSLVFVLCALSQSCGGHALTDSRLITAFENNRDLFDEVARTSVAGLLACRSQREPSLCEPEDSPKLVRQLTQRLGLPIQAIYVNRKMSDSLWIPVETSGILSISSSTRGYVYCACTLAPLTNDTVSVGERGTSYRPIGVGWMLYVSN